LPQNSVSSWETRSKKRLSNLIEAEIKSCHKDQIDNVVADLEKILLVGMERAESSKRAELTFLNVGLRYLKSQQLEKRIRGLQDIRTMIDRVWKTKLLPSMRHSYHQNWDVLFDSDLDFQKLAVTQYLTPDLIAEWLTENKVFDTIFGESAHLEIVRRANVLLMFMARHNNGNLDQSIIDLTWKCQDGRKHDEMVRTLYCLIEQMLPDLTSEVFDIYFSKMQSETKFDEKFLIFLKNFTVHALNK